MLQAAAGMKTAVKRVYDAQLGKIFNGATLGMTDVPTIWHSAFAWELNALAVIELVEKWIRREVGLQRAAAD